MTFIPLKLKRLSPAAVPFRYATDGSGFFDLFPRSTFQGIDNLWPGDKIIFDLGWACEVPKGYTLIVAPRSGHGFKGRGRLINTIGVIDRDYRGELRIGLCRDEGERGYFPLLPGKAIAQAALIPTPRVAFLFVDELSETARGEGGFGSTDEAIPSEN